MTKALAAGTLNLELALCLAQERLVGVNPVAAESRSCLHCLGVMHEDRPSREVIQEFVVRINAGLIGIIRQIVHVLDRRGFLGTLSEGRCLSRELRDS